MDEHPVSRLLAARLEREAGRPVVQLVVDEIWQAIVDGSLAMGERLPTTRELAIALNASPRTIERAYDELERRGVIATRTGAGSFVSLSQPSGAERERHRRLAEIARQAITEATALDFGVDALIDAIGDWRDDV